MSEEGQGRAGRRRRRAQGGRPPKCGARLVAKVGTLPSASVAAPGCSEEASPVGWGPGSGFHQSDGRCGPWPMRRQGWTRRVAQASWTLRCFGGSSERYESRREQRQYQCSGVHLPAQRRSAGQESGRRTGWMIQPGAPEVMIVEEEKAFDFLVWRSGYRCRWCGVWIYPERLGRSRGREGVSSWNDGESQTLII
jgi:hypothetical protein